MLENNIKKAVKKKGTRDTHIENDFKMAELSQ